MKYLVVIFCMFSLSASAQRASIVNDTAVYMEKKYAVGDTIHLAYGSNTNKTFAFIQIGGAMTGLSDLDKDWSKSDAVIQKVYKASGKAMLKAKLTDKGVNALGGNKLFIDLEGAIDNKELL